MSKPKVIFLDAVGTLFGVRGSVGEIYSQFAQGFGVQVSADLIDHTFFESFKKAPPAAFPDIDRQELQSHEFDWWKAIAFATFEQSEVIDQFTDFDRFFNELYHYFSTFYPWFVYPDVKIALLSWKNQNIELGVISNFDSRLHKVLNALGLQHFFQSITISTEVSVAKPNSKIFHTALAKHGYKPHQAWHIGDSYEDDYLGAIEAGFSPIWLQRQSQHPELFKVAKGKVWSGLQATAFS
ncbi:MULTISPECIES: HAD-IA family hydrolase [Roseofilum]|uniref:Hydrolase n=1 Tax=Roseofilum reptotaenium AO1-A TaxID=1925591 RepID=A0A1L9QU85_9CYAN|nr:MULTISPECIES: HAD-IA family hydrolase [Roseofilum]OJJ26224.1 hydrolase [Roseofilum reptotaenium AO1-A]HBQ97476.1 hydrolase [Cyanobacteria bacterium UBA11691]MBP0010693.1 HAD-IA family hydrolase [Roseofilum sp. Belize Diploria]MBP0012361.1 HAD-IA family hydrolase [Roseofilum sp. SID3]MBP0026609.1 HAD-IA family hydrolase [Roseofilum sp. SID2]